MAQHEVEMRSWQGGVKQSFQGEDQKHEEKLPDKVAKKDLEKGKISWA